MAGSRAPCSSITEIHRGEIFRERGDTESEHQRSSNTKRLRSPYGLSMRRLVIDSDESKVRTMSRVAGSLLWREY